MDKLNTQNFKSLKCVYYVCSVQYKSWCVRVCKSVACVYKNLCINVCGLLCVSVS